MVFLHGGDFARGDANPDSYGPQLFMDHGIVLVGVNYRLGVLGFLSLDTEDLPGNLGLRDQAVALRWIKQEVR